MMSTAMCKDTCIQRHYSLRKGFSDGKIHSLQMCIRHSNKKNKSFLVQRQSQKKQGKPISLHACATTHSNKKKTIRTE